MIVRPIFDNQAIVRTIDLNDWDGTDFDVSVTYTVPGIYNIELVKYLKVDSAAFFLYWDGIPFMTSVATKYSDQSESMNLHSDGTAVLRLLINGGTINAASIDYIHVNSYRKQ